MKILIFATDLLPVAGLPTSGTALRTYGLARGFEAHGHQVVISVPRDAVNGFRRNFDQASLTAPMRSAIDQFAELAFDSFNQGEILNRVKPDLIVCGHWPALTLRSKPSQPIVVDLAGPHLLERHYQGSPDQHEAVLGKLGVIATADYFIVSGPKQRRYFLSFMMRAGVQKPESRIVTIPMPLDPNLPEKKAGKQDHYPHFVFGGVFLPWQDPSAALSTLALEIKRRNSGHLTLIGGKHPNYPINEGRYAALFAALSRESFVTQKPMLPLEQFTDELREKDVAIDLMRWNLERELAMTIRSTTYLWSGLPVIYNNFADLGSLISQYEAGWLVDPSDANALIKVIDDIYANPSAVAIRSKNAQRLARELFSWDRAVEPLLKLIQTPLGLTALHTDIMVDYPENADLTASRGKALEQYFTCRLDGLRKVECRIATHNRKIASPVTFKVIEIDGEAPHPARQGAVVAEVQAQSEELSNNEWFSVDMSPIRDSAGKLYKLTIEGSSAEEAANISPWALKSSPYPLRGLYRGGKRLEHLGLCLRTTCAGASD